MGRGPFWTVVTVPAWTLSPLQEEEGDGATQTPVQIITEKEGTREQAQSTKGEGVDRNTKPT